MRVVAITGASAGIGRAIAMRLARDGASLAICARRADRLDTVAKEITQAGGTSLPFVADVVQDGEMRAFVDRAVSRWGQLDVMICNAGYGVYGTIDQVTPEKMKAIPKAMKPQSTIELMCTAIASDGLVAGRKACMA